MAALLKLGLREWEADAVLLPDGPGIRVTVWGDWFPIREVEPEILIGETAGELVKVARNLRSIHGYFRKTPPAGARILVRYGDSQEGILETGFDPAKIRPLTGECR